MALLEWQVAYGGKTPPPGAVVRPDERLSWPRTPHESSGAGVPHGAGGAAIVIDEPGAYREP